MWHQSAWDLLQRGGPIMWLLLVVSILAVTLILDRLLAFVWAAECFRRRLAQLRPLVVDAAWDRLRSLGGRPTPCRRLVRAFARAVHLPTEQRRELLKREGELILADLEKRLRWLAILGQASPMLGLLGTVTGLVSAFHTVEMLGGQVQPSDLANGIWEALLTTVFGLMIALPSLVVYNGLTSRLDRIARHLSVLASYLEEWVASARLSVAPARPRLPQKVSD